MRSVLSGFGVGVNLSPFSNSLISGCVNFLLDKLIILGSIVSLSSTVSRRVVFFSFPGGKNPVLK